MAGLSTPNVDSVMMANHAFDPFSLDSEISVAVYDTRKITQELFSGPSKLFGSQFFIPLKEVRPRYQIPGSTDPAVRQPEGLSARFHPGARGPAIAHGSGTVNPQLSDLQKENCLLPFQLKERDKTPRCRFRLRSKDLASCHPASPGDLSRVHDDAPKSGREYLHRFSRPQLGHSHDRGIVRVNGPGCPVGPGYLEVTITVHKSRKVGECFSLRHATPTHFEDLVGAQYM